MYALYYPGNASLLPHMALREAGVPFEYAWWTGRRTPSTARSICG